VISGSMRAIDLVWLTRVALYLVVLSLFFATSPQAVFGSSTSLLEVADDRNVGYQRSLFKHWIDEDKDGCDTRAEVVLEEALAKPKVGKKCALSGGVWRSSYDNRSFFKANQLDVDHLVPLAEAWRSGAWKWSSQQRQTFANDLSNKEVLIAVSASSNRSKGDRDVSSWLPAFGQCSYVRDWIVVKVLYGLTVDPLEAETLSSFIASCEITGVRLSTSATEPRPSSAPTPQISPSPTSSTAPSPRPSVTASPPATASSIPIPTASPVNPVMPLTTPTPVATPRQSISPSPVATTTPSLSQTPTPSPSVAQETNTSNLPKISAGAFCAKDQEGKQGVNDKGVVYTCKTSTSENRLRWRQ
jgi:hypothetical protein